MKITRKSIGYESDGSKIPDEVLADDITTIIIEHENTKVEIRSLRGFPQLVVVSPEGTRIFVEPNSIHSFLIHQVSTEQ